MPKVDPATRPKTRPTRPATKTTRPTPPELTFEPVKEGADKVKVLYYGDPGTGKTTALAALARLGSVIHVDAEAGVKARPLREMGIPIENIARFRTINFDSLERLFWAVRRALENDEGVIGVFMDSLTEIQAKLLEDTVEDAVEKAQQMGKARDRHDVFRDDYGRNTGEMRELVRKFRDLECHVAFSCLERRTQDEESGEVAYGPYLTPKLAGDLMGYCDIICHTIVREGSEGDEYIGVCRPVGRHKGKDRFRVLPRRLINPSFDRIVGYVHGTLSADTDEQQLEAEERWAAERTARPEGGRVKKSK